MVDSKKIICTKEHVCRVLIIDDSHIDNMALHLILDCKNISTMICKNGNQAWNLINSTSVPDLVFLELQLPGIKGFQLLEHIRSKESWKKVPIIVLSELGDTVCVGKTIKLGVTGYIHKPYDVLRLRSEVGKFIQTISNSPP